MKSSESFSQLAAALALAQAEFTPIRKDKTVRVKTRSGGEYTFTYATLDAIMTMVRGPLAKQGLFVVQSVVNEEVHQGNAVLREELLETRLVHSSGEWISSTIPIMVAEGENTNQAYGSGLSYARRYGVAPLLALVADEDDDGNAAAGNVAQQTRAGAKGGAGGAPVSEKQAGLIRVRLEKAKADEALFCQFMGIASLEQLPKSRMDNALAAIEAKERKLYAGQTSAASSAHGAPDALAGTVEALEAAEVSTDDLVGGVS